MTIPEFKVYRGSELSEAQVQEIAEDYLIVMKQMGELVINIDETLERMKKTIRHMENVTLLVSMLKRQRVVLGMNEYPYKKPII